MTEHPDLFAGYLDQALAHIAQGSGETPPPASN
jgi:hypothetical protein